MENPHQYNYTQQLEHRIKMIEDDLNMLKAFISQHGLDDFFNEKLSVKTGASGYTSIQNIEISCDLKNTEALSWGMFK